MAGTMQLPEAPAEGWDNVGRCPEGDHDFIILNVADKKPDRNAREFYRTTLKRVGAPMDEEPIFMNIYEGSATQAGLFEALNLLDEGAGEYHIKDRVVNASVFHGKDRDQDGTEVIKAKVRRFNPA